MLLRAHQEDDLRLSTETQTRPSQTAVLLEVLLVDPLVQCEETLIVIATLEEEWIAQHEEVAIQDQSIDHPQEIDLLSTEALEVSEAAVALEEAVPEVEVALEAEAEEEVKI